MKRFSLTLPSLLAGRRPGQPPQAPRPVAAEVPKARQRQLTEAEQRLLDQKVVEARAEEREKSRAKVNAWAVAICRLCDRLGQPHLASQLIGQGATIEDAVNRLCGHATGDAHFPTNEQTD